MSGIKVWTLAALLAGATLVACKPQDDKAAQKAAQEAVGKVREATEGMAGAVQGMSDAFTREAAASKATKSLEELRDKLAKKQAVQDASKSVEQARKDLDDAYGKAQGEAASWWKAAKPHLDKLASDAKAGANDLAKSLDTVLKDLEKRPR